MKEKCLHDMGKRWENGQSPVEKSMMSKCPFCKPAPSRTAEEEALASDRAKWITKAMRLEQELVAAQEKIRGMEKDLQKLCGPYSVEDIENFLDGQTCSLCACSLLDEPDGYENYCVPCATKEGERLKSLEAQLQRAISAFKEIEECIDGKPGSRSVRNILESFLSEIERKK